MDKINFAHLDPESLHTCQHCQNIYLDVDDGYKCRMHPGMKYEGSQHIAVNTCDDYLTPWANDYRRRPDLERGLQNHGGR